MPETSKLLDRRWSVPAKVVVGVGVDQYSAPPDLVTIIDPTSQLGGAINDGPVPGRRPLLDTLPIAEPSDIRPVRRGGIEVGALSAPSSILRGLRL